MTPGGVRGGTPRFLARALLLLLLAAPAAAAPPAALEAARAAAPGDPLVEAEAARTLLALGRTAEALLAARRASAEVTLELGLEAWLEAKASLARTLLEAGETTEGVALLDAVSAAAVASEDPRVILAATARCAEAFARAGRADRARPLVDGALAMLSADEEPNSTANGLALKAKLLARTGDDTGAVECLRAVERVVPGIEGNLEYALSSVSVQVVEGTYLRANHLLIAADVWLDLGRRERVAELLGTVELELARTRAFDYSDEIHAALARLHARLGDLAAARSSFARIGDYALKAEAAASIAEKIFDIEGIAPAAAWLGTHEALLALAPAQADRAAAFLARARARAGEAEAALAAVAGIRDPRSRARLLAELPALCPALAGEPSPALRRALGRAARPAPPERRNRK